MKSSLSMEKEVVKPYTDYQINAVKSQIKPKKTSYVFHASLAVVWLFTSIVNIVNHNKGLAALNLFCVLCWSISAYLNRKTVIDKQKEMQDMIDANEKVETKFKQDKENMEALDFFKTKKNA